MNTELTTQPETGLSVFDTGAFEQMGMIAAKLAESPLLPESLRGTRKGQTLTPFKPEQVASNCFRLVEQASRWKMSPFAIMDGASVVHGKLMWEGKIVSAALSSLVGVRLNYNYEGEGINRKVIVSGRFEDEQEPRKVEGTVKDWKTDQWKSSDFDQRLAYRGAREWARRHAPEVILGVYSPDEFDEGELRNVTPQTTKAKSQVSATFDEPQAKKPEPVPEEPSAPKVEKPTGKQTKERHVQEVTYLDVSAPKTSNGKTWWTAQVQSDQGQVLELNTFSRTMSEQLDALFNGDRIKIVFTKTPKGGFALESFEALTGEEVA